MSDLSQNQDLDLSLLTEIADGSNEFIVESIEMFLQQTPELLQLISNSIALKDWETTGSAAHKLKPNLGFFGMLNTQPLIQDIELSCRAGAKNPQEITAKFNQAKIAIEANMVTLAKLKTELGK
ncbi:MAG: Hpt protein [Mucilaginibacter sp.]|nr:Hpt protein [Mucilaginibacter sp.]